MLLLIELQDAEGAAAAQAAGEPAAAQRGQQPAAGGPGGLAALVEREAAAFGALRRQWAYKVAKLAVDRFHELFAPYKWVQWVGGYTSLRGPGPGPGPSPAPVAAVLFCGSPCMAGPFALGSCYGPWRTGVVARLLGNPRLQLLPPASLASTG